MSSWIPSTFIQTIESIEAKKTGGRRGGGGGGGHRRDWEGGEREKIKKKRAQRGWERGRSTTPMLLRVSSRHDHHDDHRPVQNRFFFYFPSRTLKTNVISARNKFKPYGYPSGVQLWENMVQYISFENHGCDKNYSTRALYLSVKCILLFFLSLLLF